MYKTLIILLCSILTLSSSCKKPDITEVGEDKLKSLILDHDINSSELQFEDTVYVPVYSDIYIDAQNQNSLLAATLSIRNTSFHDSLFISTIDYYDSAGVLVKKYINQSLSLPPMASLNYVVEKEDEIGGSGANFIVEISAKNKDIHPIIQAVMIGESSNKSFAFSMNGVSINNKTE